MRNSLESDKDGRLTYVQNGDEIKQLYLDPAYQNNNPLDNGIIKSTLMQLDLYAGEYV